MSDPAAEFDGPWKEALDLYFRPFVELFFPDVAAEIDWAVPVEFQDKELQQIAPDAAAGRGTVDKLARVWTVGGEAACVFVHVEVQTQTDADLARRMYRYNHRLEDRYGSMPVSLAVLGDYGRTWRPTEFRAGRWGCEVAFTFRVAKLADWRDRESELEANPNPFAAFALAHLRTVETDRRAADRLTWKLQVMRHLYDRGLGNADLIQLARLVDWMMTLPADLAGQFTREITAFEEERKMPFVTPREQAWLDQGAARGRLEGRLEGIEAILDLRFGADGLALMPRVRKVPDAVALEQFLRACKSAPDLDALRALLPPESQT
jgi:hypothetical protein